VKKIVKLLFVFLLSFVFIPMVHAEDLPREGVMYFMEYPNNTEEVTEDYEEASNPEETLIFSGKTDSNGKINLCEWSSTGQLRIIQEVPDGYTTSTKEIKVDLSRDNNVSFVNYRGIDNPKTGRSILVFLGIIGVVTITILVSRKNKKSLLIIPIIVGALAVTYVKAETCFCIQVKDGNGKALSNVNIKIYAKPNNVEAHPAVIFDANGGKFFDGLESFYVKIPSNHCTMDELFEFLNEDNETSDLVTNIELAYRDNYIVNGLYVDGDEEVGLSSISNGDVIKIKWQQDNNAHLIEVDGNGGTFEFYGEPQNKVYIYDDEGYFNYQINRIGGYLKKGSSRLIGYDTTSTCGNYNEKGIFTGNDSEMPSERVPETVYACWSDNKVDGIYVNDELFGGSPDSCFKESYLIKEGSDDITLYSNNAIQSYIGDFTTDDIYFEKLIYRNEFTYGSTVYHSPGVGSGNMIQGRAPNESPYVFRSDPINKVEVVRNGNVLVTLNEDDFELDGGLYYILNDDKRPILMDYLIELNSNSCSTQH